MLILDIFPLKHFGRLLGLLLGPGAATILNMGACSDLRRLHAYRSGIRSVPKSRDKVSPVMDFTHTFPKPRDRLPLSSATHKRSGPSAPDHRAISSTCCTRDFLEVLKTPKHRQRPLNSANVTRVMQHTPQKPPKHLQTPSVGAGRQDLGLSFSATSDFAAT